MATPLAPRSFASSVCQACRLRLKPTSVQRSFSTSSVKPAESAIGTFRNQRDRRSSRQSDGGESITEMLNTAGSGIYNDRASKNLNAQTELPPHRLHVLATKHNTHLTLIQAPRPASETMSSGISAFNASASEQKKMIDVLLSLSTGNIGFRKAGRGSYDAAYQLTAFALKQMKEKGMIHGIDRLEIVMRGFGAGREAVTKAILGAEGQNIRKKISAVVDATRLKIGGTRSPRPRRLG